MVHHVVAPVAAVGLNRYTLISNFIIACVTTVIAS